ncbi:MAG TPA: GntR family transcriptional regulator [Trebonia sp.]
MAQQPMYQQIADTIQRQIDEGELERGQQLPTELELRETFNASRNTVRDAIKRLANLGLVETRPGQGTFVTAKVDPFVTILSGDPDPENNKGSVDPESASYLSEVAERHRKASRGKPRVEIQKPAPLEVMLRLRVGEEDQVIVRHEERFIDGIPWSLMTSFYPMTLVTQGATNLLIADDIAEGTVKYLAKALDLKQASYRDWITGRAPDDYEQKFFDISHAASVFELYRTGFDQNGEPMRVTVSIFPVDRNQFIYDVGDPPDPQYG